MSNKALAAPTNEQPLIIITTLRYLPRLEHRPKSRPSVTDRVHGDEAGKYANTLIIISPSDGRRGT